MKQIWRNVICLSLLNLALVPGSSLLQAQKKAEKRTSTHEAEGGRYCSGFHLAGIRWQGTEESVVAGLSREKECRAGVLCVRLHRWLNS